MAIACILWGIMAPLGKDAMSNGIAPIAMVFIRVSGAAVCLWIADSLHHTRGNRKDIGLLSIAALLGVVFNQGLYTMGLGFTSPINAAILTTTLPIFSLVIGALFFHRKINLTKGCGILAGLSGALFLIVGTAGTVTLFGLGITGDILVIGAQCSAAAYLNIFQKVIKRNGVVFIQKWMMTFAAAYILPFAFGSLAETQWNALSPGVFAEAAYVTVFGTFVANFLMTHAQHTLQPNTIAMYNYVQPVVACALTLIMGIGTAGIPHLIAAGMVFAGVWIVTSTEERKK